MKRIALLASSAFALLLLLAISSSSQVSTQSAQLTAAQIAQFAAQDVAAVSVLAPMDPTQDPPGNFHAVTVHTFDPAHTNLVGGEWVKGTGCPTNQPYAVYPATSPTATYGDPACPTGDPHDQSNWGLLLTKTGPTDNNASMEAELHNPKGITLTELGYDIKKRGFSSLAGSHCGAGAPRFDIINKDGVFFFVGCSSPPPDMETIGDGWTRLRWGIAGVVMGYCINPTAAPTTACPANFSLVQVTGTIDRIVIVFDEGTDGSGGPDQFGAALLDNIDVNGQLVGHE